MCKITNKNETRTINSIIFFHAKLSHPTKIIKMPVNTRLTDAQSLYVSKRIAHKNSL